MKNVLEKQAKKCIGLPKEYNGLNVKEQVLGFSEAEIAEINDVLELSGKEFRTKYGCNPEDKFVWSIDFKDTADDVKVIIKIATDAQEDALFIDARLFVNGQNVNCSSGFDDELIGKWKFRYSDITYIVDIKVV